MFGCPLFALLLLGLFLNGVASAASYKPSPPTERRPHLEVTVERGEPEDWRPGHWLIGGFAPNIDGLNGQLLANGFNDVDGFATLWGTGTFSESARVAVAGIAGTGWNTSRRGPKTARLSTGFGLFELAYVLPGDGWHIQLGGMLGGGGSSLVLSDGRPSSIDDGMANRYDTYFSQTFMLIGPSAGLRADLSRNNELHFRGGYLWAVSGPWTHRSSGVRMDDGPNMSAPFFMIGLTHRFGHAHKSRRGK